MNAQEWIDRYIYAVGNALPARERADVEAEIRSLIEDELDARGVSAAGEADEQTVLAVLEQFGRPEALAARYYGPRSLIGPALYPTFRLVTAIVLLVLVGVWIFGIAAGVGFGRRVFDNPFEMIGGLAGGLFQTFGTLVFVFALIETFSRGANESRDAEKPWNPRALPAFENSARVKVGELVVGIGFSLIAIIVFNLYPEWISIVQVTNDQVTTMPLLSENFATFVPWLTVVWSLTIALNAYVLAKGRWQTVTRLLQILLNVAGLAILVWMLTDGPLLAWAALEPVARIVLAIVIAVTAIDLVVQLYRLVFRTVTRSGAPTGTAA